MSRAGIQALVVAVLLTAAAALARPAPEIRIRLTESGFEPARVELRQGESVRVILSADRGEHCFAVDALRVEKRIVAGRETSFELTPDRQGEFPFYCCVESGEAARRERGTLVVTE